MTSTSSPFGADEADFTGGPPVSASQEASDQSYYWTPEWQRNEEESRRELAAGRGITFKNVKDAIRWLTESDHA